MTSSGLEYQRTLSENTINSESSDFTTKYYAVNHLHSLSETEPESIVPETISTLERLLRHPEFSGQRRGFFLFREAADTLASVIVHAEESLANQAYASLRNILGTTAGHAHRTAAEALGSLPFTIQAPNIQDAEIRDTPRVYWEKILDDLGLKLSRPPVFFGRSLVTGVRQNKVLVFKMARSDESPDALIREPLWMEHLRSGNYAFPMRFDIPRAIRLKGSYVFRLKNLPSESGKRGQLHPKGYAIGFLANADYFRYPNEVESKACRSDAAFREIMFRNAWLLGKLTSFGIVHSAPIPLFHNRVQRERRRDHGLYEWFRGGRLDRWLESCAYPNLGLTGLRDFEHLIPFKGLNRALYRHIGMHMLSLLLVSGSYFRNQNKERIGLDANGEPVDARDLFDENLLRELIQGVFLRYYHGFTGTEFSEDIPLDTDELVSRMIEEMGVDRHMEEILRTPDQNDMTDRAFRDFLAERGYSDEQISKVRKGAEDIVFHSGPHLGGFNQPISLPELTASVETMSALCMAGRYCGEKFQAYRHIEK